MAISTKKPTWLNKKISLKECYEMKSLLGDLNLNTVCQEAGCPNISECFYKGEAAFLILGKICTRGCKFCGIEKGRPFGVDLEEPWRIAEAVKRLNLSHVVITSVTRDDLPDGGAEIFAKVISAIRKKTSKVTIEVLIPDFKLNPVRKFAQEDSKNCISNEVNKPAIKTVMDAEPEIIGHNIETVPSLYSAVRQDSDYICSLKVLELVKEFNGYTKSAIMLGLGEEEEEVLSVFSDLRKVDCDFLSIGQYLAPSSAHFPIKEYIPPEKFLYYKQKALQLGFVYVASGPYVRSSYLASEYLDKNKNRERLLLKPHRVIPNVRLAWNAADKI